MEYYLKYKDHNVLQFNPDLQTLSILEPKLLPIAIQGKPESFDLIRSFCSGRVLMRNRKYTSELLKFCNLEDQNDIEICLHSRALSLRDNYWISPIDSSDCWDSVNLYENNFSASVIQVALTGELVVPVSIDEAKMTGELTDKGTKAKSFIRDNGNIYLVKQETLTEIYAEILSTHIATAFHIPCSVYQKVQYKDYFFSACPIYTSAEQELIPCRDVMDYFGEHNFSTHSHTYQLFLTIDPLNFLKMQIFDYVTLNTDRNRDNYGFLCENHMLTSLYPLYDHDSCLKGRSVKGIYFPTNLSFADTLDMIKKDHTSYYHILRQDIAQLRSYAYSDTCRKLFTDLDFMQHYDGFLERLSNL